MSKVVQIFAWVLLGVGGAISFYFVISAGVDGINVFGPGKIDFSITGQFGDFIGGVVGTLISGSGFIFLYLTFKEQRESVAKERFESKFFDLLKIHRDNVSELNYSKFENSREENYLGRKVFQVITKEVQDCLKEVRNYASTKDVDDYVTPEYKNYLIRIVLVKNKKIDLYELISIDLAYSIVYYGLSKEGEMILRRIFKFRYKHPFFIKLIKFLQMKPKRENDAAFEKWKEFKSLAPARRNNIFEELYNKSDKDILTGYSADALTYKSLIEQIKYYGGHQHRLGHYFRHLFQSYKFVNTQKLPDNEKYFYGKTLRAQLSTYEQCLLFVNSLSSLGFKWEYDPEPIDLVNQSEKKRMNRLDLISFYNLIKNVPGEHFLDIAYKDYYPKVRFESDEQGWKSTKVK